MVINKMVLNTLRDRLSSLWDSDTKDGQPSDASSAQQSDDRSSAGETRTGNKSLSYAEQVEYGVDERELPDEDRVLRLLVKRGGRVDETTILEKTGWSEAHLAEVISEMEADRQVSAITVGRKRVVCRRGFEPKGYRSHLTE